MRWYRLLLAFGFLLAGAICIFDGQAKQAGGLEDTGSLHLLESLARSANQAARNSIEARFRGIDDLPNDIITKWQKRDYTYQTLLNSAQAPDIILMNGKRIRASTFKYEPEFLESLEEFGKENGSKFDIRPFGNSYFLYWRGYFKGEPYVSAYTVDKFFRGLGNNPALQTWIANADGKIFYHSSTRFLGESAANLKPIASGSASLQQGKELELFEKFISTDSQEIWGAWSTLPSLQLIVATEWRGGSVVGSEHTPPWNWFGGLFIFFAIASFFASLSKKRGETNTEDNSSVAPAPEMPEYVQHQLEVLRLERDKSFQEIARLRAWQELDLVWQRLFELDTGKQVWSALLDFIFAQAGIGALVFYRFSHTTCSLVPEETRGMESFDVVAQRYWKDARIFIGSLRHLEDVESTEAFRKWNLSRSRFMPGTSDAFVFIPINENRSLRGCICLYLPDETQKPALEAKYELLKSLIKRTTYLYDLKQRLLELKDAKPSRRSSLEGKTNNPRSESRPS